MIHVKNANIIKLKLDAYYIEVKMIIKIISFKCNNCNFKSNGYLKSIVHLIFNIHHNIEEITEKIITI